MNKFKSFLSPQLQQYLIYRQNLGYSMKPSLSHLKTFDRYLKQRQAEQVLLQPSFFVQMQADIRYREIRCRTGVIIDSITPEHCKINAGYVGDSLFQREFGLGAGVGFQ